MHDGTRRAIFAAFLANLGIAISKFAAFAITGSASMLAESIHSVADTGNQGLLFLGGRRSRKAPTAEHQFGFGHERYFWAFVVALVLFSLGSLFALVEGVEKLRNPEHLDSPIVAYVVLTVAIVLEAISLRTARREALPMREGRSWWRFIHTTKNAEIPVVLLEDTGALVGLFIALAGITTAEITGDPRWDAAGSLGIGLLLGVIAVILAIEMKSLLIGEAVAPELEEKIRVAITDGFRGLEDHLAAHVAPRPRRRARRRETRVHGGHDAVAGRRDRHRRSARESLGADREAHLHRARHLPKLAIGGHAVYGDRGNLMADDSAATAAAVDTFNEAFNRHDVDAVMAAMTDDCVFESTSPPFGERHEGRAAVRAAWESFFTSTPTAHFDAEDVITTGDRCVVQWRFTWKNDDATDGAVRGVDVIRVRDGKVAEKFAYVKG